MGHGMRFVGLVQLLIAFSQVAFAETLAPSIGEEKIGAITAYKNSVRIDLEECRKNWKLLIRDDGDKDWGCIVRTLPNERIVYRPLGVAIPRKGIVLGAIGILGRADSYEIYINTGNPEAGAWKNAEPKLRKLLDRDLPSHTYQALFFRAD